MPNSVLEKDKDIYFPHFVLLKASAGSGKTHTLTKRYVQFLLSNKIPRNGLRNILAVTFSNNASKEMKERIVQWLKDAHLGGEEKMKELSEILSLTPEEIAEKSNELILSIFDNYSDFHVKTLDSFMASVFKTSAIDFGYNPDFEILLNSDSVMDYTFSRFLRRVKVDTEEGALLQSVVRLVMENKSKGASYLWEPTQAIFDEVKNIYRKLSSSRKNVCVLDHAQEIKEVKNKIIRQIDQLESVINNHELVRSKASSYNSILESVKKEKFSNIVGKKFKNSPVKMPAKKDAPGLKTFDLINQEWHKLEELVRSYTRYFAASYYNPYLKFHLAFKETLEKVKKQEGKIFIEDINKMLSNYIDFNMVPDIYFRIGEKVFHYLVDEFQDTSPLQWANLFLLLENSLAEGGSLFVVGDTKQAIYGFRDADYRIMKEFEGKSPFLAPEHSVKELDRNYRSRKRILDFNERVFKDNLAKSDLSIEAEKSGLNNYHQEARKGNRNPGYVEVSICEKNDACEEKQKILALIGELIERGYSYDDLAILTSKNEDVIQISTWLNEGNIPFVSYSNLDIRKRRITGEIVSLLSFLNSPLDDLSFAAFCLGDIFSEALKKMESPMTLNAMHGFFFKNRKNSPYYKTFQSTYEKIWEKFFSRLFKSAGYLPLYDLVDEIFRIFMVFDNFKDEEATLAKILEVIKDFEEKGNNNLGDFLDYAETQGDNEEWNINVPEAVNAIKVMTVHKSKGLGFTVVINILYGEKLDKPLNYIFEEKDSDVRLLKLTKNIIEGQTKFSELYYENISREKVNRLNSLYVGFTRAKSELYVIGVKGAKDKFPFELLPVKEFQSSPKPGRILRKPATSETLLPTYHHNRLTQYPETRGDIKHIGEKKRGEFIHNVLSHIGFVSYEKAQELEKEIEKIMNKIACETREIFPSDEIKKTVKKFLLNEKVRQYFREKSGRTIKNEQEFTDHKGNLIRMDRVIFDKDVITIVDFKSGKEKAGEKDYIGQIRKYMRTLMGIYPGKAIRGILAYVDLADIRAVFNV